MVAFGQGTDGKIDRLLLASLSGDPDATAPLFVILAERADVQALSRIPDRAERGRAVVAALQVTARSSQAVVTAYLRKQGVEFVPYWVQNAVYVPQGTFEMAQDLAAMRQVAAIIPEPVFAIPQAQVETSQATATAGVEWNISKINADRVWPATRGADVVVASIDTGVRYTHNALVRQYRGNLGASFNHTGNWKDPTGVCGSAPCDNADHGTHVTGTMVGDDGGSNHIGVAPAAEWIACKGCRNSSTCQGSHLMTCAQWMMDPLENGSGNNQPDVVNNSWGGGSGNAWFMEFVDNWRAAGIFPAFSAGNSGPSCGTAGSPGDYPQSFSAGSTDSIDIIASTSSRGPSAFTGVKPNVTAPGVQVRSSIATGNSSYATFSGTSMASPHVAGTVALAWSYQTSLRGNVAATELLLRETAVPFTTIEACGGTALQVPNNVYGHGRIDALLATGATPPSNYPPVVTITNPLTGSSYTCPATVNFSAQASDTENEILTGSIAWSDNGTDFGAPGGSVSRTYACTQTERHSITASVTDRGGLTDTDAITIQVTAAPMCKPKAAACTLNSECCSGSCTGKKGAKVCK